MIIWDCTQKLGIYQSLQQDSFDVYWSSEVSQAFVHPVYIYNLLTRLNQLYMIHNFIGSMTLHKPPHTCKISQRLHYMYVQQSCFDPDLSFICLYCKGELPLALWWVTMIKYSSGIIICQDNVTNYKLTTCVSAVKTKLHEWQKIHLLLLPDLYPQIKASTSITFCTAHVAILLLQVLSLKFSEWIPSINLYPE